MHTKIQPTGTAVSIGIDTCIKISLGNNHEMKAFYVPEFNSNAFRVNSSGDDPSVAVNQLIKAAAGAQSFSQSLWEWCLERQRARAFRQLSALGISQEIVSAEWPNSERQHFDQAILMGVRDWSNQYWNENVFPRLLPFSGQLNRRSKSRNT
ncbi:hypothetical protein BJ322DRAFT_1069037 [Thelephora terrestris]|uniref:Uncharacterized protein n=1 Tax=Thelephora terrestris TaxID=56493 RepID=A0A9P6HDR5_9AGAM|nr:hypothetical protein BJ322DRAFT_1069037 [Thelephora terrestris]